MFVGCGDGADADAGIDGGARVDGGGRTDAGPRDAGPRIDGGDVDGGDDDGGAGSDAGDGDGGAMDGGVMDGGVMDGGGAMDAGSDAGSAPDGGPAVDASSTSITISSPAVYGSCFLGPPDPILAFWEVNVTGAPAGVTVATLVSAQLTVTPTSGAPIVQTLTVDFPAVPLSGGSATMFAQRKTAGTPAPTGACTDACVAGATWQLQLVFDVGGVMIPVTVGDDYFCVV